MRRRRVGPCKAAVIAAHVILSVAATAHAECAWVLWSGAATPLAGYASQQECESARNDDHALAQLLSRAYARPQALECLPDTPIVERRFACTWTLWRVAVPSARTHAAELDRSPLESFQTRELCEGRRAPGAMNRDERELTSCLPDTVSPARER